MARLTQRIGVEGCRKSRMLRSFYLPGLALTLALVSKAPLSLTGGPNYLRGICMLGDRVWPRPYNLLSPNYLTRRQQSSDATPCTWSQIVAPHVW